MSAQPMVTKGTFADFRIVKTRKLAQLVIEVPIEEADAALAALGGLPRSDSERWVAVARLDINSRPEIGSDAHMFHDKERHAFCDLPFPQQAGIKSNDKKFQIWMNDRYYGAIGISLIDCADAIREYCGVKSRADILPDTEAGDRWLALLDEFEGVR